MFPEEDVTIASKTAEKNVTLVNPNFSGPNATFLKFKNKCSILRFKYVNQHIKLHRIT